MERELGISRLDLQHAFEAGDRPGVCECGRPVDHDLHTVPGIQQTASYSGPILETEKGS